MLAGQLRSLLFPSFPRENLGLSVRGLSSLFPKTTTRPSGGTRDSSIYCLFITGTATALEGDAPRPSISERLAWLALEENDELYLHDVSPKVHFPDI